MPIVSEEERQSNVLPSYNYSTSVEPFAEAPDTPKPTFTETLAASFRTENEIGSFFNQETGLPTWATGVDLDFDPIPMLEEGDDPRDFLFAKDEQEVDIVRQQVNKRKSDREVVKNAGLVGILTDIAAGTLSPTFLLPVGGVANGVRTASGIVKSAASIGAAGGAATAVQEGFLQSTQAGRTLEESAINVGGATVLSALLGGGIGAYSALKGTNLMPKSLEDIESDMVQSLQSGNQSELRLDASSAGAAQVVTATSEQMTPSSTLGLGNFMSRLPTFDGDDFKFDPFNNPQLRILFSESDVPETKKTLLETVGTPLELKGNASGTFVNPVPVEHAINVRQTDFVIPIFEKLRLNKGKIKKDKSIKMSEHEFNVRVFLAARNNFKNETDERILDAARATRDGFASFTPELEEAGLGFIKATDEQAYVPQLMNPRVIGKAEVEFEDLVRQQFYRDFERAEEFDLLDKKIVERLNTRIKDLRSLKRSKGVEFADEVELNELESLKKSNAEARRKQAFAQKVIKSEIDDAVSTLTARLQGSPDIRDVHDATSEFFGSRKAQGSSVFLKNRKIQWDDDIFQEMAQKGFIESDVERVVGQYARTMVADLELAKRFGDVDGTKRLKSIEELDFKPRVDKIKRQIRAVKSGNKQDIANEFGEEKIVGVRQLERRLKEVRREAARTRADIGIIFQRLSGRMHPQPNWKQGRRTNAALSVLKDWNTLRFMGGVAVSSMPDLPRLMLIKASAPVFADAIKALPLKAIKGTKNRKRMLDYAQNFGTAINRHMIGRAHKLYSEADEMMIQNSRGIVEKSNDFTSGFFHHTGMNWWNDTMQGITAEMVSSEIIDVTMRVARGGVKKGDKAKLSAAGITDDDAKVIAKLYEENGFADGNLKYLGFEDIDISQPGVRESLDKFKAAVRDEVNTIVIEPSAAEKPVFMEGEFGSLLGQFKTFGYASMQKSTLIYAQRMAKNPADFALWSALTGQIAMGMLVTLIKIASSPKTLALAGGWTASQWVAEGVDRSGIIGSFTDQYNMVASATGSTLNLAQKEAGEAAGLDDGIKPLTRYQVRNQVDRVLGPSFGLIRDVPNAVTALAAPATGNPPTQNELKAVLSLMPYHKLPGIKDFLNLNEDEFFEEFNIPKSRKD